MTDNKESISVKLRRLSAIKGNCYREAVGEYGIKCSEISCSTCRRLLMTKIADEIDAEKRAIYEAQKDSSGLSTSPHHVIKAYAENVGKPMQHGESITDWLARWYFEKPMDDNNEPVDLCQIIDDKVRGEIEVSRICYTKSGFYFNNSRSTNRKRRKMKGITYAYGKRVKRPVQAFFDAEGLPIENADRVWIVPGCHCDRYPLFGFDAGIECVVVENKDEKHKAEGRICVMTKEKRRGYPMPEQVTHREPDTQERIDDDATMPPRAYYAKHIGHDVGLKDDEEVWTAVTAHLLRRQRELDGRDA